MRRARSLEPAPRGRRSGGGSDGVTALDALLARRGLRPASAGAVPPPQVPPRVDTRVPLAATAQQPQTRPPPLPLPRNAAPPTAGRLLVARRRPVRAAPPPLAAAARSVATMDVSPLRSEASPSKHQLQLQQTQQFAVTAAATAATATASASRAHLSGSASPPPVVSGTTPGDLASLPTPALTSRLQGELALLLRRVREDAPQHLHSVRQAGGLAGEVVSRWRRSTALAMEAITTLEGELARVAAAGGGAAPEQQEQQHASQQQAQAHLSQQAQHLTTRLADKSAALAALEDELAQARAVCRSMELQLRQLVQSATAVVTASSSSSSSQAPGGDGSSQQQPHALAACLRDLHATAAAVSFYLARHAGVVSADDAPSGTPADALRAAAASRGGGGGSPVAPLLPFASPSAAAAAEASVGMLRDAVRSSAGGPARAAAAASPVAASSEATSSKTIADFFSRLGHVGPSLTRGGTGSGGANIAASAAFRGLPSPSPRDPTPVLPSPSWGLVHPSAAATTAGVGVGAFVAPHVTSPSASSPLRATLPPPTAAASSGTMGSAAPSSTAAVGSAALRVGIRAALASALPSQVAAEATAPTSALAAVPGSIRGRSGKVPSAAAAAAGAAARAASAIATSSAALRASGRRGASAGAPPGGQSPVGRVGGGFTAASPAPVAGGGGFSGGATRASSLPPAPRSAAKTARGGGLISPLAPAVRDILDEALTAINGGGVESAPTHGGGSAGNIGGGDSLEDTLQRALAFASGRSLPQQVATLSRSPAAKAAAAAGTPDAAYTSSLSSPLAITTSTSTLEIDIDPALYARATVGHLRQAVAARMPGRGLPVLMRMAGGAGAPLTDDSLPLVAAGVPVRAALDVVFAAPATASPPRAAVASSSGSSGGVGAPTSTPAAPPQPPARAASARPASSRAGVHVPAVQAPQPPPSPPHLPMAHKPPRAAPQPHAAPIALASAVGGSSADALLAGTDAAEGATAGAVPVALPGTPLAAEAAAEEKVEAADAGGVTPSAPPVTPALPEGTAASAAVDGGAASPADGAAAVVAEEAVAATATGVDTPMSELSAGGAGSTSNDSGSGDLAASEAQPAASVDASV